MGKKIGILTQPLAGSYGGILQAYAMQKILFQLGYDSIILNRVTSPSFNTARYIWRTMKFLGGQSPKIRVWPNRVESQIIYQHTFRFINQYLNVSPELNSTSKLKRYVTENDFMGFVVGSDQVWRKSYSPCIENYFLDFIDGDDSFRKIAYAASFGIDYWEYGKARTKYFSHLAKQFDAIGVREDTAVDLCEQFLNVNATHVLDPTMLLDKGVYGDLAMSNTKSPSGDLFAFILDRSDEKSAFIDQVGKKLGLTPYELLPNKHFSTIKSNIELEDCIVPPIEQWLRNIMEAKFVVTDSFHGTVFSIIFNKPFITIANKSRGLTRFSSLLKTFGLTNRLVFLSKVLIKSSESSLIGLETNIVNEKLKYSSNKSLKFLNDIIG